MNVTKYAPRPSPLVPAEPFLSAEEVWFWFVRCQKVRLEGGRLADPFGQVTRPCDPDDVYRILMGLRRAGRLAEGHVRVLAQFGLRERAPDPRERDEEIAARLWDEALDLMSTVFRAKGILS